MYATHVTTEMTCSSHKPTVLKKLKYVKKGDMMKSWKYPGYAI
jgi:hypothetical protein